MTTLKLKKHSRCLAILLALTTTACALSPQVVDIRPPITVKVSGAEASKAELALEVLDSRDSQVLGSRGGVYNETATVSTRDDITEGLRKTLAIALQRMGYRVADAGSAPVLRVEILALDYSAQKEKITWTIETHAAVKAVFSKDDRTYTNTYKNTQSREMLTAPDKEKNETLINETLAVPLQRMLNDEALFDLIES